MLHFWKKMRSEKADPVSNGLDPKYDGPLRGFEAEDDDTQTCKKSRLNPSIFDVLENKSAFNYFKHFLSLKASPDIVNVYCSLDGAKFLQDPPSNIPEDIKMCKSSNKKIAAEDKLSLKGPDFEQAVLQMLKEYWTEFMRSEGYFRYQMDLLTSRTVTLNDILFNNTAMAYFMQYLEQEKYQNVAEFWMVAKNFEQYMKESSDHSQALSDAVNIYEKYLSLEATSPLGISEKVRSAIEERICSGESEEPLANCFEPATKVAIAFLRIQCLPAFLSSQHYVHLLSDIIRSSHRVCTASPTSSVSELSIKQRASPVESEQFHPFWERKKNSGLSFGRIDQLGRFQRDIEPEPDRRCGFGIAKAVKKFVKKNENKVEEEMAWQVAEMVVKDITDLTMGCHFMDEEEISTVCKYSGSKRGYIF